MKVDLSKDPLFDHKEPLSKQSKDKEREKYRMLNGYKTSRSKKRAEPLIQIIDPLPEELIKYRKDIEYKKNSEFSRASLQLKKYIIQQQRSLKCVRLEKITGKTDMNTSRSSRVLNSDFTSISSKSLPRQSHSQQNKEIDIPKIEQLFKEQQKEYVLYESRMMRNQLSKAIELIDSGVNKIKSYSNNQPELDTRRSSVNEKLPSLNLNNNSSVMNEQDYEIDRMIEKNFNNSRKLRDKMSKQKKEITSSTDKLTPDSKNMSFYLNIPQRPKKKVLLSGVKSITFSQGDRKIQITPASSLLISINRMSHGKQKKQEELEGLIKNSYQNRESALCQKSLFYQQENPFNNLNPSSQFKLRQIMNKNLQHRLELSKNQVNKFVAYLGQIKELHVILNETILSILKEIRELLLSGKVMKVSDLSAIISKKQSKQLNSHPNSTIIKNLTDMMV